MEPGDLVLSEKGRDKDRYYVVMEVWSDYCFIADGDLRKTDRPKKKKMPAGPTGPSAGNPILKISPRPSISWPPMMPKPSPALPSPWIPASPPACSNTKKSGKALVDQGDICGRMLLLPKAPSRPLPKSSTGYSQFSPIGLCASAAFIY